MSNKNTAKLDSFQSWCHLWGRVGTVIALVYMSVLPFIVLGCYDSIAFLDDCQTGDNILGKCGEFSAIADAEFQNKRLRTFLKETELERILKKLHRQAKVSVEENGANTLYLALGFLKWYETDQSSRPRFAPLVLIPVDLVRNVQKRSYLLRIRGEEIQMNITLLEMLRQFFGIRISGLDPLPMDESGIDLPLVFNTIRKAVMAKKGWDIMEYAFLGQFSFSQFLLHVRSSALRSECSDQLVRGDLCLVEPLDTSSTDGEQDRGSLFSQVAFLHSHDSLIRLAVP